MISGNQKDSAKNKSRDFLQMSHEKVVVTQGQSATMVVLIESFNGIQIEEQKF